MLFCACIELLVTLLDEAIPDGSGRVLLVLMAVLVASLIVELLGNSESSWVPSLENPADPPFDLLRRIAAFLVMICREAEASVVAVVAEVADAMALVEGVLVLLVPTPCFITIILRLLRHSVVDDGTFYENNCLL